MKNLGNTHRLDCLPEQVPDLSAHISPGQPHCLLAKLATDGDGYPSPARLAKALQGGVP